MVKREVEMYTIINIELATSYTLKSKICRSPVTKESRGKDMHSDLEGRKYDKRKTITKPHDCIKGPKVI